MFINHIYWKARENPLQLAVVSNGEQITYARFASDIEAVRNHLTRAGLPDDGVTVRITGNLYYDWVLLLAAHSLGRTTVAGSSWQVIESLDLKNITGLVCLSGEDEATAAFSSARPDGTITIVPRRMLVETGKRSPPLPVPEGRSGDHIVYTSGTTGAYKKVLMSGDELEARLMDRTSRLSAIAFEDVYYGYNFGPWTAAGYNMPQAIWRFGATLVLDQRPDWGDHFFDFPVTKTFFVPGLLDQVCKMGRSRPAEFPTLCVMIGGGFLDARLARELREGSDCEVLAGYGGTEFRASLESIVHDDEDVVWLGKNFVSGLEIVDEQAEPVPIGVEGELRIAQVSFDPREYIDDPEATAKFFRHGYFYPGDMAVERADGRICILGRVEDVLNLAGAKIAIEPFEDAVRKELGIERLCAFVQQDSSGKEMLVVVIEGTELPDQSRLEALASKVKQVPQIRYSLIGEFPHGENGMMKINRRKVLDLVRSSWAS